MTTTDNDTTDRYRAPLESWLTARLGADAVVLDRFDRPGSGFSAETVVLDARIVREGAEEARRFVLRKQSPEPPVYPVQVPGWGVEVALQYEIMSALGRAGGVPVAEMVGYEADPAVLGTPFFVMHHVEGRVPIESPPYTQEGFFAAATPAERSTLLRNGLATMVAVHRVDWRAAGLDWLIEPGATPDWRRQLAIWEHYADTELQGRHHPAMEQARAYLHANPPADSDPVLCWGDARPGNMIWGPDMAVRCATDFEAASIGPAESDLGWWLLFDRTMHEAVGVTERTEGDLSRPEQLAIYEELSGCPVADPYFWEVFAGFRYSAIVVRVMNRTVARGLMPPDHQIWLHNPASAALEQVLAEH